MSESTKVYSDRQEKMIANYLGWKQVTGSGSRPCVLGDVVSGDWLGECKTHTSAGHRINFVSDIWRKISDEAYSQFKKPVLFVDNGSQKSKHTWCLITSPEFTLELKNNFFIYTLPTRFLRKNISFLESDLTSSLGTFDGTGVLFETVFCERHCVVCKLETFRDLIEGVYF